jgi:hypothetical protein
MIDLIYIINPIFKFFLLGSYLIGGNWNPSLLSICCAGVLKLNASKKTFLPAYIVTVHC